MRLIVFLSLFVASCSAWSQDINFDDLRRAGRPLVKSYSVPGTATEGRQYFQQFAQSDGVRVEQHRKDAAEWNASHPICRDSDVCWQMGEKKDSNTYYVNCLRGPRTGQKETICTMNGKWGYRCGWVNGYHQDSATTAAKKACDL